MTVKLQGIQHSRRSLLWEDLIEPATKTESGKGEKEDAAGRVEGY